MTSAAKLSEALSLLVQRSYGHSGEWLRTSDVRMLLDDPDHALAVFRARCAGAGVPATSRDVFEGYCDAACDYPITAGQRIRTEIIGSQRMISHESCPTANLTDARDDQEALTEVVTLAIYEGKSTDPDPTVTKIRMGI